MVIEQVFDIITLILNKSRRGFVKTSQKLTAVRQAQLDFHGTQVEVYRKQGFIPATLKKFTKSVAIPLLDGVGPLPSDFSQELIFETDQGYEGEILSPQGYRDRVNSFILAPDQENPIGKIQDNQLFVQPDEYSGVNLIYFRLPVEPLYATTVSPDGRQEIFDATASVDLEFSEESAGDIARIALVYLGIAFQNTDALQLAVTQAANDNQK